MGSQCYQASHFKKEKQVLYITYIIKAVKQFKYLIWSIKEELWNNHK